MRKYTNETVNCHAKQTERILHATNDTMRKT